MQNLIDNTIPDAAFAAIKQGITDARGKLAPYAVGLTDEQRHDLFKMGDKSVAFIDKIAAFLTDYPDYVPRRVSPEAFASDLALFNSLRSIRTLAAAFLQTVDDTMMAAGSDMMEAGIAYYRSAQDAAEDGDATAKAVFKELNERFPFAGRRKAPDNTPDAPNTPPTT